MVSKGKKISKVNWYKTAELKCTEIQASDSKGTTYIRTLQKLAVFQCKGRKLLYREETKQTL